MLISKPLCCHRLYAKSIKLRTSVVCLMKSFLSSTIDFFFLSLQPNSDMKNGE